MIDLIIYLTLLQIGMNCDKVEDYNKKIVKIENIMNKSLPCRATPYAMKNQCNDVNLNAILRNYHFNIQANQLERK